MNPLLLVAGVAALFWLAKGKSSGLPKADVPKPVQHIPPGMGLYASCVDAHMPQDRIDRLWKEIQAYGTTKKLPPDTESVGHWADRLELIEGYPKMAECIRREGTKEL